jgi:hypothetical protein
MLTKTVKAVIFFITMRVGFSPRAGQALCLRVFLVLCLVFFACRDAREEGPVLPPETSPLSRPVIGYGVINVSYTYLSAEPREDGASLGYLRRASLVSVIERKQIKEENSAWSWVLVEGTRRGWLREEVVDIYDNALQAKTASESMTQ